MVISALAGLTLMVAAAASPVAAPDTVEVTFRCPSGGVLFTVNWDNSRKGSYSESGKSHDITFTGAGYAPTPLYHVASVTRSSTQTIRCEYRSSQGQGHSASYSYTVNRQIIACPSRTISSITCKLKEEGGK